MTEQFDRGFRCAEGRDAGLFELATSKADEIFAHPAGDDGFVGVLLEIDERFGYRGRVDDRLWREHHQHAVDVGILAVLRQWSSCSVRHWRRRGCRPGCRATMRREKLVKLCNGPVGQFGKRDAQIGAAVGCHDARPAAVGDDGEAVAARTESANKALAAAYIWPMV